MSSITKVCVYSDRVLVTRELELSGKKGDNSCRFSDITPGIEADSLRVKGKGDIIITDNSLAQEFLEDSNIDKLNRIKKEIEELLGLLDFRKLGTERVDAVTAYLEKLNISEKVPDMDYSGCDMINTEDLQKLVDHHAEILKNMKDKKNSLLFEIEDLENDLKKLSFQVKNLKKSSGRSVMFCTVNFRMEKPGDVSIQISYITAGASWKPLYDGRLIYGEREFELVQYAEVTQVTGEDWEDVLLELSTAKASTGASLPEPEPWYLDIYLPPPPVQAAARLKGKADMRSFPAGSIDDSIELSFEAEPMEEDEFIESELEADLMVGAGFEPPGISEDQFTKTEVSSTGFNATYKSGTSQDIPTGGAPKKVMLGIHRFPADYKYIIMPAVDEAVYLKIEVENSLEYPLLNGPVKTYRDHNFRGESVIDNIVPGEKLKLYMGIDDSFRVKRELLKKQKEKKGLTGKDTSIEYSYRITVESYRDNPEKVSILEQIPVSMNREIEISLTEKGIFKAPDEKGIIKAELEINPKEKMEIIYTYSVRYPADMVVYGLDED